MKQRWQAWKKVAWDERLPRERQTLSVAATVLAPVLVYFILWQPAHGALSRLHSVLPAVRLQAAQMQQQAGEVEALRQRSRPAVLDVAALKAVVENSAAQYQLREAMERIDPVEPNGVRVVFASVSYAQWLHWVRQLQQEQHIRVDSLDASALPSAGMVKLNAVLVNGTNS